MVITTGQYNVGASQPHSVRRFASLVETLAPHSCALWLGKGEPWASTGVGECLGVFHVKTRL